MFLSFLITSHNETASLKNLISIIIDQKIIDSEIIVIDDFSSNDETLDILKGFENNISVFKHNLNYNFGEHKNYGIQHCKGDWIFQLDADEYPEDKLIRNISQIINTNTHIDVIYCPRINYFSNLTNEYITMWKCKAIRLDNYVWDEYVDITSQTYTLLENEKCIVSCENYDNALNIHIVKHHPLAVNYPDYQARIFKNNKNIEYTGNLHEILKKYTTFSCIPESSELNIIHKKTVEQQMESLKIYHTKFSKKENNQKIATLYTR